MDVYASSLLARFLLLSFSLAVTLLLLFVFLSNPLDDLIIIIYMCNVHVYLTTRQTSGPILKLSALSVGVDETSSSSTNRVHAKISSPGMANEDGPFSFISLHSTR
jgi:hypothetical protein